MLDVTVIDLRALGDLGPVEPAEERRWDGLDRTLWADVLRRPPAD